MVTSSGTHEGAESISMGVAIIEKCYNIQLVWSIQGTKTWVWLMVRVAEEEGERTSKSKTDKRWIGKERKGKKIVQNKKKGEGIKVKAA